MSTDGNKHCIVLLTEICDGDVLSDAYIGLQLEAALHDALDLGIQGFSRKTVCRDAVSKHSSCLLSLLINLYLMSHKREIVSCTETCGTATDNCNLLTCCRLLLADPELILMLNRIFLKSADINRIVNHGSSAAYLTRMLADHAADCGKRIVLSNKGNRVIVTAFMYK